MVEVKREDRQAYISELTSGGPESADATGWVVSGAGPCAFESWKAGARLHAKMRERVETAERNASKLERERDEALSGRDMTYEDFKAAHAELVSLRKLFSKADKWLAERDELRDKLDKTLVELQELRAKATPPADVLEWATGWRERIGNRGVQALLGAATFIRSLAHSTKPKRKTRLEAAACAIAPMVAQRCSPEDVVRAAFAAACVEDPDEELPEEP